MPNKLEIRAVTQRDLPELMALYEHLTKGSAALNSRNASVILKDFNGMKGCEIFVATVGGTMVSSCTLVVIPNLTRLGTPYALIENVVTHKEARNKGFGRAVLLAAVDAAWAAGCYKVMLLAGSKSDKIMRFYERAGFSQSKTGFQIRRIAAREG